ncbi:MAG: DUF1826 domain-containing protein [Bacteroidota bacterium]
MIQSQEPTALAGKEAANWKIGTSPSILKHIHDKDVNIAIYDRDIGALTSEVNDLLAQNAEFKSNGDVDAIIDDISKAMNPKKYSHIIQDIKELLLHFEEVVHSKSFRLLLATINTNMCRKFHTDINDVRLLCTYSGPGTMWLTDDNINRKALSSRNDDECIAIDESRIQQANTGSVVLLKGAIYPQEETKAIVHRSPTIEESGEKRLLLRIDTNETSRFWS